EDGQPLAPSLRQAARPSPQAARQATAPHRYPALRRRRRAPGAATAYGDGANRRRESAVGFPAKSLFSRFSLTGRAARAIMLRFASSKWGLDRAEAMRMATPGSAGSAQAGRFDAFRLATRGEVLAGEVDLVRRSRVLDRLAQTASSATVSWRIEGSQDALRRPMLTLTVQGSLPLVCQRCLQPFEVAIEQRSELLLARDEAELARLDAEEREVVLASTPLDAMTLVEDELLLSLPFAP